VPLAPYISSFTKSLDDQGFVPESSHVQTRLVADFSCWLKQTHAVYQRLRTSIYRAIYVVGLVIDVDFLRQQGAIVELPIVAIEVTPDR